MSREKGQALADQMNPDLHDVLEDRYGDLVPGLADTVVDMAYGQFYARDGLGLKQRYVATIAALTVTGGQTQPQLRINIAAGMSAGLSPREIAEVIWQMALYGGLPAAINALNTLRDVLAEATVGQEEQL